MARPKLSKTEKIRRALKKNPDANPKELAEKIGTHSSAVYKARKKLANGEPTKPRGRPRRKPKATDPVTFKRNYTPTDATTVTMSSGTNMQMPTGDRPRPSLVTEIALIEGIGVERVKAILGLLES